MEPSDLERYLLSGDSHLRNFDRWRGDASSQFEIVADHLDVVKHLFEISRYRHLFDRIREFAIFDPDTGGAARVIAGYEINTETDGLG